MTTTLTRTDETVESPVAQVETEDVETPLLLPIRRLSREEYYRAAEAGVFRPDEKLELIEGEVIQKMSPQNKPHAFAIVKSARQLVTAFGLERFIFQQMPLFISDDTEPEPDLMVVNGPLEKYLDHPTPADVLLIVEVSDSSATIDTRYKASLYAKAGIQDYWVLLLNKRSLRVHREPQPNPKESFGFNYTQVVEYSEEETVSPLMTPHAVIAVRDLLPFAVQEKG